MTSTSGFGVAGIAPGWPGPEGTVKAGRRPPEGEAGQCGRHHEEGKPVGLPWRRQGVRSRLVGLGVGERPSSRSPHFVASAASGNVCALHKFTKCLVLGMVVPPGDVAADGPCLDAMALVIGSV